MIDGDTLARDIGLALLGLLAWCFAVGVIVGWVGHAWLG